MAWIRTIDPSEATGLLRRIYDAAVRRAGKVFNILRIQSIRPETLDASLQLYLQVMHRAAGGLTRAQREMIATVVSSANGCHYWTLAHGEDLRVEVHGQEGGDELAAAIAADFRRAPIGPAERAMLEFAVLLTREPRAVGERDIQALRAYGFDDLAIHDIVQITGLFNYYNRLADGLGVDAEV